MTREEVISELLDLRDHCDDMARGDMESLWMKDVAALSAAIDVMKEQSVLEDIVEDIKELDVDHDFEGFYKCQSEVLSIIESYMRENCSSCILDETDACSRGAGRAVDDEICDRFISEESVYEN